MKKSHVLSQLQYQHNSAKVLKVMSKCIFWGTETIWSNCVEKVPVLQHLMQWNGKIWQLLVLLLYGWLKSETMIMNSQNTGGLTAFIINILFNMVYTIKTDHFLKKILQMFLNTEKHILYSKPAQHLSDKSVTCSECHGNTFHWNVFP